MPPHTPPPAPPQRPLTPQRPPTPQRLISHLLISSSAALSALIAAGCLELSGAPDEPCGGRVTCSAPRACVNGECVGACVTAEDCEAGERCDRQLCVPVAAEPALTPDMTPAPDMTP